jgi:serine/threonine protein kinase
MTPERWQQVKQIFNSALRVDPSERAAFLSEACGGDEALRKEVETLIEADGKEGSFIDSPALKISRAFETTELKPGQTVGSYVITCSIGRGGMGEVYLANDIRLSRRVRLRSCPRRLFKDAERMRRFEQEARTASALNHPNIITIYEISEANSTLMIATEFVEGITLRQRMASGQFLSGMLCTSRYRSPMHYPQRTEQELFIAISNLRNIMIRPDGYVKVLDFGLAKLVEPKPAQLFDEAPTQVKNRLRSCDGNNCYMSPEQARGQSVDARSGHFQSRHRSLRG